MLQRPPPTLSNLLKTFGREVKTLIYDEIQLVKTEITQNFSECSGDLTRMGIGAVAAYVGFTVLLFAFGSLATFGFRQLKIDPLLAMSAGFGAVGLLAIIVGTMLLLNALIAFSRHQSLTPERAIANLYKVRGEPVAIRQPSKRPTAKPQSRDLARNVMATEDRLGRMFEELECRLTFAGARQRLVEGVRLHPYRFGMLALFAGFAASLFFTNRFRI